jgi:hypothetical protein
VLPPGFAVRVKVLPAHNGPLLVGAAVGIAFTVTEVVYTVAGLQPGLPEPSVTVKEYVAVTVGVAVGFWAVVDDKLAPLHEYTEALVGFAVSITVPLLHMGLLFVGAAVGVAFTVAVVV